MADATTVHPVRGAQVVTRARFWMTRAGYGLVMGAVVAVLEFAYYFPLLAEGNGIGLNSLGSLLVTWCGEFLLLALAVGIVERRVSSRELRAPQLALSFAFGALASALIWHTVTHFVLRDRFGLLLFVDQVGQPVVWPGQILYHCWIMLFFGGLAAVARSSQQRRTRMLAALRAAELGRARSQQRLAEVTLGSLQSRIDPEFLFRTLTRLEQLFEADPRAADRLLEELIAYLRAALADVQASIAPAAPGRAPGLEIASQMR